MDQNFTEEEIRKAKSIMESNTNFKVADVQRAILKGYIYTAKLIDFIKENKL